MAETDWRKILSYSQKQWSQDDKEELCDSLSWMEADDIDLNFSDLKTLFRLSQDILKYKSEQVKNLQGELETVHSKLGKKKSRNADSDFETITHQEEVIKANKEVLEQLYASIAKLEGRRNKYQDETKTLDKDSESSPDVLSEMDAKAHLENEIVLRNKHIRKLLGYIKILEEENFKFKEKVSILKEKLQEATTIIENLTEQILNLNNECNRLKDNLGSAEQMKFSLLEEINVLKESITTEQFDTGNEKEDLYKKIHQLKSIVRAQKTEIDNLALENVKLKEKFAELHKSAPLPPLINENQTENSKIKELGEKLVDASNEILRTANIIDTLKRENIQLKALLNDTHDTSEQVIRNESDDGKKHNLITKLKKKVHSLTIALKTAEEILDSREKEILDLSEEINTLQSEEGVSSLLTTVKSKKREIKIKDEEIKSLVKDINKLSDINNQLQLENETMRQKLNLSPKDIIPTGGILLELHNLRQQNLALTKDLSDIENQLITIEMDNREKNTIISKQTKILKKLGFNTLQNDEKGTANNNSCESENHQESPKEKKDNNIGPHSNDLKIESLVEENEGLRKGLEEILLFLKESSSSGVLSFECPSLEAVLHALEARHAAGWFAPHMAITMQLKAALGGKDALLSALKQSRVEIYELMSKLSTESQKCAELQNKLYETQNKIDDIKKSRSDEKPFKFGEFSSWILNNERHDVDLLNKSELENLSLQRNFAYEQEVRSALIYFRNKYEILYDKMTEVLINTADDKNNWSIMEENYKAQIENLKAERNVDEDEDVSDVSPGLVIQTESSFLQRKCNYLEELYRISRTSCENIKNELLDMKKMDVKKSTEYDSHIQSLLLSIVNLTDKLRKSINEEIFWKQNSMLNEMVTKYRQMVDKKFYGTINVNELYSQLEISKRNAIDQIIKDIGINNCNDFNEIVNKAETEIIQTQLQEISLQYESKCLEIEKLSKRNIELQEMQTKLIDNTAASETKEEIKTMRQNIIELNNDNLALNEKYKNIQSQMKEVLLQVKDDQHRRLTYETEINMLRHQILDLQSDGDNKAIVTRLSNEVFVAHIQVTDCQRKIENLKRSLDAEQEIRTDIENAWKAQQKVLDMITTKCDNKFRYLYEVLQILRLQYQGSIPLISAENYLNNLQEISNKTNITNEKLIEVEDLRYNLMTKHSLYNQVLELTKANCSEDLDNCQHRLQLIVSGGTSARELEFCNLKLMSLEETHKTLLKHCSYLEKTLILVNQGFQLSTKDENEEEKLCKNRFYNNLPIKIENVNSDEESTSKECGTFTLPKPQTSQLQNQINLNKAQDYSLPKKVHTKSVATLTYFHEENLQHSSPKVANVIIQTNEEYSPKISKVVQTDEDIAYKDLNKLVEHFKKANKEKDSQLAEISCKLEQRSNNMTLLGDDYKDLYKKHQNLIEINVEQQKCNDDLNQRINLIRQELDQFKISHIQEVNKIKNEAKEETHALLLSMNRIEDEKNKVLEEYKRLIENEREECDKTVKDLQSKIAKIQAELDGKTCAINSSNADIIKESIAKYTAKNAELEDKCFKLKNNLDDYKTEVISNESELQRWKDLATERLEKMEQMSIQLKERHYNEVESYKAENHHWLSQLSETQREHNELRSRMTEQKAIHVKQLLEKDHQIEHLRSVVNNLKTQIMNMQTMLAVNDPSFDLSAIVEVEEASDVSQQGSDRLELKFDSTVDLHEIHDDFSRMATSTAIWQEPVIERLRREKQLLSKQNGILRRQIKAVAARERRARLDAQNLKSQVFRISTSGGKAVSAESAALHSKIATLQAQLTSARRETPSSVALWDKWKRAQQASERWQARFEEKCQEVNKLDASLHLAKSAVSRLEKEKRLLLSRLNDAKNEKQLVLEKQDGEISEKRCLSSSDMSDVQTIPVSTRALLERIEAQQRRIAALEVAEKGNEPLVSEYEKALAEITSLKGQVLKLESTLLESQIRSPIKEAQEVQPELEYWKRYCDMLKEENAQLTMRVTSLECAPTSSQQHRVNDLEQTVLTLRGLVSKLQAEQKSSVAQKRIDSRPSSGRTSDKTRSQLESCKTEISNLKRSIHEKDTLLEKSKDMLRIAAEREDELLNENAFLRRQLEELTDYQRGPLSA